MAWKPDNLFLTQDDLDTEYRQCADEGKNLVSVEDEFARLRAADLDAPENQTAAMALLDKTLSLPMREDYAYREPSDLEGIRAERPVAPPLPSAGLLSDAALLDKLLGAWLGRCAGCLLGKPLEGAPRSRTWGYLRETGNWPLQDYMRLDVDPTVRDKYQIVPGRAFIDEVDCMPEDDDTNYTVIGLEVMKRWGRDFTSENMAEFWFETLPMGHTWSAERVALRNLALGIGPPRSGFVRNPFREWIGAQIRADFFGYVAPGDPDAAAGFAFRDARLSHFKNGIYGEMWVAAMLAAAAVADDIPLIIEAGLARIPERCRLAESIREVLAWRAAGLEYDVAVERIHARWVETRWHDLVHVISNAMIVAVGLLWGEGDFETSVCRAVQPCFDTDCNGATVGSIVGMILGAGRLPEKWIGPLNDELITGVAGRHRVRISAMARESVELVRKIMG